jgi:hypothetical protein
MTNKFSFKKLPILFLAILAVMGTTQVEAQNNNPGPNFGVKGGINLSQLYVDQPNAEDESMKVGVHFGLFGKIPLTNFLAFQPEMLYSNVGSKITYGGSDLETLLGIEPGEVRFNLNYIQVPLGLAVNLGPLSVHAGPYFSYLMSANVKNLETSDLNTTGLVELDTDDFNKLDYGLMGGVAIDVQNLTLGVRYNHGLREIGNSSLAGTLTNNSKNSVAQLYIGIGL